MQSDGSTISEPGAVYVNAALTSRRAVAMFVPMSKSASKIEWVDIRKDKVRGSTHMAAELNGHRAEVCAVVGDRFEADAGGYCSYHRDEDLAMRAAEKRLREAAAKGPAPAPRVDVVQVRPDGLLTDEGLAAAIAMGAFTVAQGSWLSEHGYKLLVEARDSRALLGRIVAAWRSNRFGALDSGLIEEAEKLLGIEPAVDPLAAEGGPRS